MSFKDVLNDDVINVFLDVDAFAEARNVIYEGETYENVPMVLKGLKQQGRRYKVEGEREPGIFLVTTVVHFAAEALGGVIPEKNTRIKISEGDFFREFYVVASVNEMGMVRLELEALDE